MIKLTLVIGQDRRRGRVPDRGKWPMPGPQDERGWCSVEQLQMYIWLDMKGKSDVSWGRSSRIKLHKVILRSLDNGMPLVFYAEKNDTITFFEMIFRFKNFWKIALISLWRKRTLKDDFGLPVKNRCDGNKTRGKEPSFEVVVESQIRDGSAIHKLSSSQHGQDRLRCI